MTGNSNNPNNEELNRLAVNIITESVNRLLEEQAQVVLGIPGGRSVIGIFELLKKEDLPWEKLQVFMVDERLVPLDDPASNFKLAQDALLTHLIDNGIIPNTNVHPFIVNEAKPDYGINEYEQALKACGGKYDIILLSAGEDGHVAALFPNHHSISNESEYFITMKDSPKPPSNRMTSSKKLLLSSKIGILLFINENKRDAYKNYLSEDITYEACPAKLMSFLKKSYVITNLE